MAATATHAVGIDVGGTTIKVCVAGRDGRRVADRTVPTPRGVPELVRVVGEQVAQARREAPGPVAGVGVVVPGIVDEDSGTAVLSANLGWRDVPMRAMLAAVVGGSVAFGHDVRAGALAESRWGAGSADMLYVPIGTGIAAGVVLGGRTVSSGGYAGEIGQVLVTDPYSGGSVRLEIVASAAAIARRDAQRRGQGDVEVGDLHGGARAVMDRARRGDEMAQQVFAEAIAALGDVLAVTIGVLGPVRIVVGGGLVGAGEMLLESLRQALAARLVVAPVPVIAAATLGSWSQSLGAAAMAFDLADAAAAAVREPVP